MADEEWLPFIKAAGIVSRARNVSFDEAEALLGAAIARGELHTEIDQQLVADIKSRMSSPLNKRPAVESWPGLDILRESAARGHLAMLLHKYPLINEADLESWLHPPAPVSEKLLKFAQQSVIEDAITWVYDEAEKAGDRRPNIKQLAKPVQARLKALGYKQPSGRKIMEIGGAEKFAKRRGESGKRVT
jgi:hypothetical protein